MTQEIIRIFFFRRHKLLIEVEVRDPSMGHLIDCKKHKIARQDSQFEWQTPLFSQCDFRAMRHLGMHCHARYFIPKQYNYVSSVVS